MYIHVCHSIGRNETNIFSAGRALGGPSPNGQWLGSRLCVAGPACVEAPLAAATDWSRAALAERSGNIAPFRTLRYQSAQGTGR